MAVRRKSKASNQAARAIGRQNFVLRFPVKDTNAARLARRSGHGQTFAIGGKREIPNLKNSRRRQLGEHRAGFRVPRPDLLLASQRGRDDRRAVRRKTHGSDWRKAAPQRFPAEDCLPASYVDHFDAVQAAGRCQQFAVG